MSALRFAVLGVFACTLIGVGQARADTHDVILPPPRQEQSQQSDPEQAPPPSDSDIAMPPMLQGYDLNGDGRITRAEIDEELRRRFDAADLNHDGVLDGTEFATMTLHAPPRGRRGPPNARRNLEGMNGRGRNPDLIFKHLDWNLDGVLSFEEFAAPVRQMAMHFDLDGDGVITPEEIQAAYPGPNSDSRSPDGGPTPPSHE